MSKNNNGITLIALSVTIIILIILSGVTISTLTGENGILTRARLAKQMTTISNEKEAIQLDILLANMEKTLNNKYCIGKPLYDKTIENGNKWNIIVENKTRKTYGTGWYLISKYTEIENFGKTNYTWVANYTTGELNRLENDYVELSYENGLAVTDGLIFNVDFLNMSDINSWGNGVKLYGFDDKDEEGGYKDNALVFDGKNDYITIDGNLDVKDEITFEFFGNIKQYGKPEESYFVPLLGAYNARSDYDGLCIRMYSVGKSHINTNFGYSNCGNSDIWESDGGKHNLKVDCNVEIGKKDNMFTVTYNHNDCMYKVYLNGSLVKEAKLDKTYWENFRNNDVNSIKYYQIGKVTWWNFTRFFDGKIYSTRIYNKALNETDVMENYNKTVAYRSLITKNQ